MGEAAHDLRQLDDQSYPEDEKVFEGQKSTAKNALKTLRKAVKKGTKAEVGGIIFEDPKKVYENLSGALEILNSKGFKISNNDLYFRKFPGEIVGEAIGKKIEIDPTLLMHPVMRIVHAIAHELGHYQNKVNNDGLVEAFIRTVKELGLAEEEGGGLKLTEKYNEALENFYEFVRRVSKNGEDPKKVINKIYKYYYNGKYENIYLLYKRRFIKKLKDDSEKEDAFEFFQKVFPELEVQDDGWFHFTKVTKKEELEQEANVFSLDEYRKNINEKTEGEIS